MKWAIEAYSLDIEQVKIAIDAFTSYYEMVRNIIENDIKITAVNKMKSLLLNKNTRITIIKHH